MEARSFRPFAVLALATLAGVPLAASDPPHWESANTNINCTSPCHVPHQAAGTALGVAASNVALCQSCHFGGGMASALPVASADRAVPGMSGIHHAFDVPAVQPAYATQQPLDQEMKLRVMGGNVVCSTCHDQHKAESARRGRPRVSMPRRITALGSTGVLTAGGVFNGPRGVGYLLEVVVAGDETTAEFRYSKDNGMSWFPNAPATLRANPNAPLDSGVRVSFAAGSYAVGERWQLYASWPFLRAPLDRGGNAGGDAFCRDCHRSWVMDGAAVATWDGALKSHPVGVALPVGDPRFHDVPLDGNWQPQGGGGDSNPTNDLKLDNLGNVQCLTCHGVHYADSNTLTVDAP